MRKGSVVILAAVIGSFAGAAMAADLTTADYQYLKAKMNKTKEQVQHDINASLWGDLHQLISSNATLEDKRKFYATLIARSTCFDLKDQGVLPADMKC